MNDGPLAPDAGRAPEPFESEPGRGGPAPGDEDHLLTVILDGENAWGGYRDDGRPFLEALYRLLATDPELRTVSFREYLKGNPAREVQPHPLERHHAVSALFSGSWVDEAGSGEGVDLGTWIGEEEENRAWELLRRARDFLEREGATPDSAPEAFEALYVAEGSDWFWWMGADQESGRDEEFDYLFRTHLKNVYRARGAKPPVELDTHIVPRSVLWTHVAPVSRIPARDRLTIRTHCPGEVEWIVDDKPVRRAAVTAVGGVMAGASRHQLTLGPFPEGAKELRIRFECRHVGCPGTEPQEQASCHSIGFGTREVDDCVGPRGKTPMIAGPQVKPGEKVKT